MAMFFVHSAAAWLEPGVRQSDYWRWSMLLSGMVAPVFMFLAGVSICLVAHKVGPRPEREKQARWKIALRGLNILLLGYGLHVAFWAAGHFSGDWTRILKVDILHCIGLCLAVFPFIAWPRRTLNWNALVLFLLLPILSQVTFRLPLQQWMPEGLASYLSVRPGLALFPFVPYATWVAFGLFVGPMFVDAVHGEGNSPGRERRFWMGLLVAAALMYGAGKGIKMVYFHYGLCYLGGEEIIRKGLIHLFFMKGAAVLALFFLMGVSTRWFDRGTLGPVVLLGKTSLFTYCVHLMIIYHGVGPYVNRSLQPLEHAGGAVLLTACMVLAAFLWQRWPPQVWFRG